jgi:hypothetical protein
MGASFLSLRVKIPAFWLREKKSSIGKKKGRRNLVDTIYSTW